MRKVKLPATIVSGEIKPKSPRNYQNALTIFDGKEVVIEIGIPSKVRSNNQNNYLWGVPYRMIAEETGDDAESIHNFLRNEFLSEPGNVVNKVKSTSKLSTTEFNTYVDNIIKWAAEFLSMYIPLPNEMEFYGEAKRPDMVANKRR